jgi:hypothetical protein
MSLTEQTRNCIDKYLEKFGVILETCEKNSYSYRRKQIQGTLSLYKNKDRFGIIEYDLVTTQLFRF